MRSAAFDPAHAGLPVIYQGLTTLWVLNCAVSYTGTLSSIQFLYIDGGATFNWR